MTDKKIVFIFMLCLSACAPKLEERLYSPPLTSFGPRNADADLKLSKIGIQALDSKKLAYERDQNSSEFFNTTENLFSLSKEHPELKNTANILIDHFYDADSTTSRFQFGKGLYLQAAIGETQADAKDAIFNVVEMLHENVKIIQETIMNSQNDFEWPESQLKLNGVVDLVQEYLRFLEGKWAQEKLDPRVYKALIEGIDSQSAPLAQKVRGILNRMQNETRLSDFISSLDELTQLLGFELDSESKNLLAQGMTLANQVDSVKDEADGLKVLISIWRLLDAQDRKTQFDTVSPKLYDFLKNASETQLKCLEGEACGLDIYTILARNSQIRPQILAYGIEKLKAQINAGGVAFATKALIAKVTPILRERLPALISDRVALAFKSEEKVLADISKNLKGFLAPSFEKWSKSFLLENSKGLNGLEYSKIHLQLKSSTQIKFSKSLSDSQASTGAASLGASMSALGARWQFMQDEYSHIAPNLDFAKIKSVVGPKFGPAQRHMQEMLAQIQKALAIGGFRISNTERFPSLARAIDPDGTLKSNLDLKTFIDSPISFAVPNTLYLVDAFRTQAVAQQNMNVNVDDQASLLKGFSKMITFFRDWETNSFDRLLGNIKITDLVTDPRLKGIDQKIFPKDIIFTLMMGDAAVILDNFTKNLSPILRLDDERNTFWQNEKVANVVSAMAALVNIHGGQRADVADASALAHQLEALIEFYNATEGVEKTNSIILLAKDKSGNRATLKALADGRKSLFLFVTAISNFLTHEMQAPDGGIYHSYDLKTKSPIKGPRELKDQVAVIQALTAANKFLSEKTYSSSALEIYYFMNQKLWLPSERFYALNDSKTGIGALNEVVMTLNGVASLRDDMPQPSLNQWNQISELWFAALKDF
jgi:hypothetical protein